MEAIALRRIGDMFFEDKKVVMDTKCVNRYCVQVSCTLTFVTHGRSISHLRLRALDLEHVGSEEGWAVVCMGVSPRQALLLGWGAGLDMQRSNQNYLKAALEFRVW